MSTATGSATPATGRARPTAGAPKPRRRPISSVLTQIFLIVACVLWILPIAFAAFVAFRPYSETSKYGYVSWPRHLTLKNFSTAWTQSDMWRYFENSVRITLPAVVITLLLASAAAFVLSQVSFKLNIALLIMFTAGNLLPPQVIITPLYRIYLQVHLPHLLSNSGLLYNSLTGLVAINVSFQVGFCVFVLSNYMKTIPEEIQEAALVDGASLWTRYWRLTLPLCRPALAALATLLTTWIYNDFFWAITLIQTGNKRPITAALANLQGQFVTNQNLIAAAALMAAVPTLVVYLLLQKQFIAGLSLGATKG